MKIAALYPIGSNEEHYLDISLKSVSKIVDEIIVLFDYPINLKSKINCEKILSKYNSKIFFLENFRGKKYSPHPPRKELLKLARKNNVTHFVWIDCDEFFSNSFIENGRAIIEQLKPGEKICMKWTSLWREYNLKRVDKKSIWSNIYKDFIVHDIQEYNIPSRLHEPRTQGPTNKYNTMTLKENIGEVFHMQFLSWKNCKFKQAWYMARELELTKKTCFQINREYFESFNELSPKLKEISKENFKYYEQNDLYKLKNIENKEYWLDSFEKFFENKNIIEYEQLDIWKMPDLEKLYEKLSLKLPKRHFLSSINHFLKLIQFYTINLVKKVFNFNF